MNEQNAAPSVSQDVTLRQRRELEITGVSDVIGFDENSVTLRTALGRLDVEGEGLSVVGLSSESGRVRIVGSVSGLWSSEEREKRESRFRSFFGRKG